MLGDDDFNIRDDIFGAPDIDHDGDVDMMDAMLRDDMDEDVKRIFFDSDPLYTDEDALFEDEEEDDFGGVLYDDDDDGLDDEDD